MSITSFIVKNTIKNIIYYIPVILIFAIGLYIYRQYNKPKEHFAQLSKQADFMMFYADWCPHCTHAKPEFKKVMDKLSSGELNGHKINVKMINAEENKELDIEDKSIDNLENKANEDLENEEFKKQNKKNK